MSTVWKVLIALALVLPMGAFVAGSLVASAADDPAPRETIQIRSAEPTPSDEPADADRRRRRPPTATPPSRRRRRRRGDHPGLRRLRRRRRPRRRRRRRPTAATTTTARRRRQRRRRTTTTERRAVGDARPQRPSRSASGSPRPSRCSSLAGLVGAGVVVYTIESQRLDQQIAAETDQEFAELASSRRRRPETDRAVRRASRRCSGCSCSATCPTTTSCWSAGGTTASAPSRPAWDAGQPERLARRGACARWSATTARPRSTPRSASSRSTCRASSRATSTGALVVVTFLDRARAGPARDDAHLRDRRRPRAAAGHRGGCVAVRPAALAAADAARDRRRDHRDRPVAAAAGHRQRRHHRAHPHLQRDARPAGGGVRRPAAVPRRRRPRAEDPAHRAARPPRAARHRQPRGGRRDPGAAARRDRPDVPAGRRPDPARQERPARLPAAPGRSTSTALTRDLVAKARGLGDRDWALDGDRRASRCVADEQRLTQAVLQLADNAVKHTRDGDEIAIGSSYDDGVARLWVRDTGPGVPPEDRERIFERFGRSAVPPGDEGFGLGLSIVGAIAAGARRHASPSRTPSRRAPGSCSPCRWRAGGWRTQWPGS